MTQTRPSIIMSLKKTCLTFSLLLLFPLWVVPVITEEGKIQIIINKSCAKIGVPPAFATALFYSETGLKSYNTYECKVKALSYSVPQILCDTAMEMGFEGKCVQLSDPAVSIPLAVKYVRKLIRIYHGDLSKVVSHYKTGHADHPIYYERLQAIQKELKCY